MTRRAALDPADRPVPDVSTLRAVARAAGLDALGVASAERFTTTLQHLRERGEEGLSADMAFTYRRPERSTDPSATLPRARSLVVGALGYERPTPARPGPGHARVAMYAWRDNYTSLRRGLDSVAESLRAEGWRGIVVADDNALVDREAAVRAGLGWYGKNANVLLAGKGSWYVLGSIITDAPLAVTAGRVADGCGSCTRCLGACPTGAIIRPGVIDARRCLAWLVQSPAPIPREHRVAVDDRIYGCDDCQEVCPPNRSAHRRSSSVVEVTVPRRSTEDEASVAWVDVIELLDSSDEKLLDRYGRWYIPRREPRFVRRTALVVLGNLGDRSDRVVDTLERYLAHDDPLLRSHAVWAARRLGLEELVTRVAFDTDPQVRAEVAAPAPPVASSGALR